MATLAGWVVAEMGRQPWVVYGQLPTAAAAVLPTLADGVGELLAFAAAYGLLGAGFAAGCWWLLAQGPGAAPVWAVLQRGRRRAPAASAWAASSVLQ